jgi:hypothetical protein
MKPGAVRIDLGGESRRRRRRGRGTATAAKAAILVRRRESMKKRPAPVPAPVDTVIAPRVTGGARSGAGRCNDHHARRIRVHPVLDLFPILSQGKLSQLADDISRNGLLEPIILNYDGWAQLEYRPRFELLFARNLPPTV